MESELARLELVGTHSLRLFLRRCPAVAKWLKEAKIFERSPLLAQAPTLFRSLYLDKTPGRNWMVPWHQDRCIVVEEKHQTAGFQAWSMKDGQSHVIPPRAVLEAVTTLRIHLDDCCDSQGSLRVIPGSHRFGPCQRNDLPSDIQVENHECALRAGDALFMKPLLFHASSPCTKGQEQRRVLHFEFASASLPPPLRYNLHP